MIKYDLIVVGMGPSAIFLAYELIEKNNAKNVLLIDEGKPVERRYCPVEKAGECLKCKPFCNITSGFSGAGAFSDGKLSLYNKEDDDIYVGGNLHKYIGVEKTKELIDYADSIYLKFGADKHLEGMDYKEEVEDLKKKAKKEDITLIGIPIRHLGTEKSHEIYKKIEDFLQENNINMLYETIVKDLIIENGKIQGVKIQNANNENDYKDIYADKLNDESIVYLDDLIGFDVVLTSLEVVGKVESYQNFGVNKYIIVNSKYIPLIEKVFYSLIDVEAKKIYLTKQGEDCYYNA